MLHIMILVVLDGTRPKNREVIDASFETLKIKIAGKYRESFNKLGLFQGDNTIRHGCTRRPAVFTG